MRAEDVPAELVMAAGWAYGDASKKPVTAQPGQWFPILIRAALAAVIPLIEARERERCAKVADGTTGDPDWPGEAWIAQRIAAAIRARTSPEPGEPV